jgi:hypothetical protein
MLSTAIMKKLIQTTGTVRGFVVLSGTLSFLGLVKLSKFTFLEGLNNENFEVSEVNDKVSNEKFDLLMDDAYKNYDEEYLQNKANGCSFCKQFIYSPCKIPFINWLHCIDKAKAEDRDYVESCKNVTRSLHSCVFENQEFFENEIKKNNDENTEDIDNEEKNNKNETEPDIKNIDKQDNNEENIEGNNENDAIASKNKEIIINSEL